MRAFEVFRRSTATILMTTTMLSACMSWQAQPVTPEQAVSSQWWESTWLAERANHSPVRVQRIDGSRVVLDTPSIGTDSLLGSMKGKRAGVPLAEVSQLAVRQFSPVKTAGVVFGLAVGAFVVFAAAYVIDGSE